MALVLSLWKTRLYHDRFNFSDVPALLALSACRPGRWCLIRQGLRNGRRSPRVSYYSISLKEAGMKCPFCNHLHDKVVDSRESKEGDAIRRRRECLACERRFTTYERIDEVPYMVIKKDGRREKFDRQKVLNGLLKACEKRPVSMARLSELVNRVESKVSDSPDREIATTEVGEFLMESLRELDKIAYVRFASVYRDFQDEQAFFNELKNLMRQKMT
jgi:transcriptional repressor NrdR